MLARQGVESVVLKRLISGSVTVYLPPKSTVYRHELADLGDADETTVDSRIAKIESLQWFMAVLGRSKHPFDIPRDYVESGGKRLPRKSHDSRLCTYTARNTVVATWLQRDVNRR